MNPRRPEQRARILVIEDDPIIRGNAVELLSEEGFEVSAAENGTLGIALAKARAPELVLCDIMLPGADGYAVLRAMRDSDQTAHVPFIFLTAKADRADIRAGMNLGADDYITKPFTLDELLESVRTRLRRAEELESRARAALAEEPASDRHSAVAALAAAEGAVILDPVMQELYAQAGRAAATDINVLILGETGVGKEILARAVHGCSPRNGGPFVALNCAALSETLLEAELFGNERGAFTGAVHARGGLLEAASSGTVFLDEVGELPHAIQAKLLRAIEEHRVLRVGGRSEREIDVRFVAATNRDLDQEVLRGRFREDLYYRLNGMSFTVPPLRERRTEIAPLSRIFLARANAGYRRQSPLGLSPDYLGALERYDWPGNVRELKNVIERGAVLCQGTTLLISHLPPKISGRPPSRAESRGAAAGTEATPGEPIGPTPTESLVERRERLQHAIDDLERERIRAALDQTGGNQTAAAERLGVSRRTLVYRLTALGLPRPRKKA
jgi:two-component system, NtrC family, response regulator AtoC